MWRVSGDAGEERSHWLVSEADADIARCLDDIRVELDRASATGHLLERYQGELAGLLGNHAAQVGLGQVANGGRSQALGEQTVERDGGATALQVAEHERTSLAARRRLDLTRQAFGDAAEDRVFLECVFVHLVGFLAA